MGIGSHFQYQHDHPPSPFNPDYDLKTVSRYIQVTTSMSADDFYATHSREECRVEWGRRYDAFSKAKESGI